MHVLHKVIVSSLSSIKLMENSFWFLLIGEVKDINIWFPAVVLYVNDSNTKWQACRIWRIDLIDRWLALFFFAVDVIGLGTVGVK